MDFLLFLNSIIGIQHAVRMSDARSGVRTTRDDHQEIATAHLARLKRLGGVNAVALTRESFNTE